MFYWVFYRFIVYHLYLVITNELLRLEQRSLEAVTLHGPSNFWASRILLIAGVTQSWQASRGSLLAKYLVRSRFAGHRKLTISPKWTHPSLDILRSSYESKIKKNKNNGGFWLKFLLILIYKPSTWCLSFQNILKFQSTHLFKDSLFKFCSFLVHELSMFSFF